MSDVTTVDVWGHLKGKKLKREADARVKGLYNIKRISKFTGQKKFM